MFDYDYSKLEGIISEKFGTQARFAKAMSLSERSISLKLNNKITFTQDQIERASNLLGINSDSIALYFFSKKVKNA